MAWYEVVIYPFIIVVIGMSLLRMMGKRAAGEVTLMDLLIVIILANILSQGLNVNGIVQAGLVAFMLFISHYLVSFIQLSNRWRKVFSAQPIVLVRHGNIDEKNLRKARITIPQLLADLRVKGYPRTQDVEFAIMEEMGRISVIPKPSYRPLTPNDIQMVPPYEGMPAAVIIDGRIIDDNLERIGRDRKFLLDQLKMQGYGEDAIRYLSLVTVNSKGQVYVDINDDMNQGKVEARYQSLMTQVKNEMQKAKKSPEDPDYGIVDDYISPK